eukprot:m.15973 g.15973  ORF g.15973 m.15973 type:complete len:458 (-) comp8732_c0_seq1:24-1397(-)
MDLRARAALMLALLVRCVPEAALRLLQNSQAEDDPVMRFLLAIRTLTDLWGVYAAYVIGSRFFSTETSLENAKDRELFFWRKLRSFSSRSVQWTDPRSLQTWTKLSLLGLVLICLVETIAGFVYVEFQQPGLDTSTSSTYETWYHPVGLAVDMLRDAGRLVQQLWQAQALGAVCAAVVGVVGLATVMDGSVSVLDCAFAMVEGLVSYLILFVMKKFLVAFLCIVACIDLGKCEAELRQFQRPEQLLHMTRSQRMSTYTRIAAHVGHVNQRLGGLVHVLVVLGLAEFVLDACGLHPGGVCAGDWRCDANDVNCVGPLELDYVVDWARYLFRHAVPGHFVLMVLFRMSTINYLCSEGMLCAMHAARFQFMSADDSVVPVEDGSSSCALDNLEVLAWVNHIQNTHREHVVGIKLFGTVVGRWQIVYWVSAWVLSQLSQKGQLVGGTAALMASFLSFKLKM